MLAGLAGGGTGVNEVGIDGLMAQCRNATCVEGREKSQLGVPCCSMDEGFLPENW